MIIKSMNDFLKTHLDGLKNDYDLFDYNDGLKEKLVKEFKNYSRWEIQDLPELAENCIEFLGKWKYKLWLIIKDIEENNKISKAHFNFFQDIYDRGEQTYQWYRKIIKKSYYDSSKDLDSTPFLELIRQELLWRLPFFPEVHSILYQIINEHKAKEDENYIYLDGYTEEWEETVKEQAKSKEIDKRTIKKYATVDKLEYSVDSTNSSLKLYINWAAQVYQTIHFSELGFLTEWGKPNKRSVVFHRLVKGSDVHTNENNRQQVSKINNTFKEILKLENKVIEPINWKYKLQIAKKQSPERVITDDVLSHHWRHISLPKDYENMPNFASEEVTIDKVLAEGNTTEEDSIVSLDEYEQERHSERDDWQTGSENCE